MRGILGLFFFKAFLGVSLATSSSTNYVKKELLMMETAEVFKLPWILNRWDSNCVIKFIWHHNHSGVSVIVADALVPNKLQDSCKYHDDRSTHIRGVPTSSNGTHYSPMTDLQLSMRPIWIYCYPISLIIASLEVWVCFIRVWYFSSVACYHGLLQSW